MSLAPTAMAGPRAPSPVSAAGMNFASNNPFRRAASPVQPPLNNNSSSTSASNNPFLDPPKMSSVSTMPASTNPFDGDTFKDLSLLDTPITNEPRSSSAKVHHRTGTMPSGSSRRPDDRDHSRRRPQDSRGATRSRADAEELDIFASPPKASGRPRRNSESSVMDRERTAEDERRRRERRREREARREKERRKDGKSSSSSKTVKKPQGLDLIDKLDVTGIYGPGLFHHDGPFDACNPHRNRKKDYRAPMQAFPTGSANNTLGGSGPVNANIDLDRFHGRGQEGFSDFATSGGATGPELRSLMPKMQETFSPTDRIEQLHGEETEGLGTSTFLDGAPAPRSALQRRESENDSAAMAGPGLGRKKSLAVRLRGLSQPRKGEYSSERVRSPDARYGPMSPDATATQSAGGIPKTRFAPGQEKNPFFNDYDDAYEKKGTQIRIAESANSGRARAPSSPGAPALTRSITAESAGYGTGEPVGKPSSGGFLNRMKSLKGGRRTRPERRLS